MNTDIKIVEVMHYWDGPLAGTCQLRGRDAFFCSPDDPLENHERTYHIIQEEIFPDGERMMMIVQTFTEREVDWPKL